MIATGFVEAGVSVIIASRKEDSLKEVTEELSAKGDCSYLVADLSTEDGCRGFGAAVAERWDSLDILVNNAGANWGAPLAEQDHASWARVLNVNVEGVFHTTKFLLPLLQAAGTAEEPARDHQHRLRRRHPGARVRDVRLLVVEGRRAPADPAPGQAPGPRHHGERHRTRSVPVPHDEGHHRGRRRGDMAKMMPLKRIGRPEDMAGPAIFLSSKAGAFLTGTVIPVDGGIATTK